MATLDQAKSAVQRLANESGVIVRAQYDPYSGSWRRIHSHERGAKAGLAGLLELAPAPGFLIDALEDSAGIGYEDLDDALVCARIAADELGEPVYVRFDPSDYFGGFYLYLAEHIEAPTLAKLAGRILPIGPAAGW